MPDGQSSARAPIIENKSPAAPSVFSPGALLREARRQKGIPTVDVPAVCILDPDGDIVRRLRQSGQAQRLDAWPCYHTELYSFVLGGRPSASSVASSVRHSPYWWRKSCSPAAAAF